jgi:hypothetical protein
MKLNYLWLILLTILVVLGLYMADFNPEQAGRLAEAQRDAAFSGTTRDFALMAIAVGLGAFIVYLAVTRR